MVGVCDGGGGSCDSRSNSILRIYTYAAEKMTTAPERNFPGKKKPIMYVLYIIHSHRTTAVESREMKPQTL